MSTQTGSISFEATGGFNSYAKQNYATLSQIKGQFATCGTGASTAAKVATIVPTDSGWTLYDGATITVKFTSKNTISAPTLNVNGTGAKPIKDFNGNNLTQAAYEWPEGAAMSFTYDGTYWRIQDSNLMERVHSAETAIEQNASEIELRATKEEINNAIDDIKITKSICGRSITTEDAADLPLLSLDSVYGESVQNGTPTPDAPVHIQTVRGKNLADTRVYLNAYVTNSTITELSNQFLVYCECEPNTTYAISKNITNEADRFGVGYTSEIPVGGLTVSYWSTIKGSNGAAYVGNRLFRTVKTDSNAKYLIVWAGTSETFTKNTELQITKGILPLRYRDFDNIEIEIRGKNLVTESAFTGAGRIQANGTIYTSGYNDGAVHVHSLAIEIEPNTSYTFSFDNTDSGNTSDDHYVALAWYTKDGLPISRADNFIGRARVVKTYTSPNDAYYAQVSAHVNVYPTLQFEHGETPTDYEPYQSIISYLDLKGNELYGLKDSSGNWTEYRDVLSIDASGHVMVEKRTLKLQANQLIAGNYANNPTSDNTLGLTLLATRGGRELFNKTQLGGKTSGYPLPICTFLDGSRNLTCWNGGTGNLNSIAGTANAYPHSMYCCVSSIDYPTVADFNTALVGELANEYVIVGLFKDYWYTIDLGYIDLPQVSDGSTVHVSAEIQPYICGTWWTKSGQEAGNAHYSSVKENAELRIAADEITSEVSKISSAKYVNSSIASWTLDAIKTNAADDGVVHTWNISSSTPTTDFRVGDTVYVKCIWTFTENSTTKTSPVYIKTTVKEINSATQFTAVSHGYENVLPVDSIKSTINQSADSVKIAANHVDIEGAAIFSSGGAYDKSTTVVKSETQWYSSTSATSKSGGSWGTTQPTVTAGRYIWQRELVTYANGSTDYKPSEAGVCTQGQTDLSSYSTTSQMNAALAGKADTSLAVSRTQRIYYQSASTTKPETPGTTSSDWVSDESGAADKWTLKRMSYSSAKPYIYTCEQKQVVSGTVSYTPVLLDDTTTVIDGGKIITGSVQANAIKADSGIFNTANIPNLSAAKITSGDIAADRIKTNVVNAINATVNQIDAKNIKASELQIGQSQVTNLTNDIVDAKKHTQVIVSASNVNYVANTCTLTARLYIDGVLQTGTSLKWQWYRDGTAQGSQMTGATGTLDVTSTLGIGHRYSCKCTF